MMMGTGAPTASMLVPPSPAAASLERSLSSDGELQRSMGRIKALMGEAGCEMPDLLTEVVKRALPAGAHQGAHMKTD